MYTHLKDYTFYTYSIKYTHCLQCHSKKHNKIKSYVFYVNCVGVSLQLYYDVAIVEGYGRKLTHNIFLKKCVKREHINEQHKNMFRESLYLCVPLTL